MNKEALSVLGLAQRAGKTCAGGAMVTEAIRSRKKPELVILCSDASDNTAKRISDACSFHGVELVRAELSMEELAAALGKSNLSACVCINDRGFKELVLSKMK